MESVPNRYPTNYKASRQVSLYRINPEKDGLIAEAEQKGEYVGGGAGMAAELVV